MEEMDVERHISEDGILHKKESCPNQDSDPSVVQPAALFRLNYLLPVLDCR
jgi:hypothetical protein